MDKLTEIKEKLNVIYKEYKDNKSKLNKDKIRMTAKLIVEMTFSENVNPSDVATELARFSVNIVNDYFESLTKSVSVPLEVLDEVLKELYNTYKDSKLLQYCVTKYAFAITSIMKYYKNDALKSVQLPILVAFIAQFAIQSNKYRDKFRQLINNTSGGIYLLDYTDIKSDSLKNIWDATKSVFADLSEAKYESFITEWGAKYGFITPTKTEEPASTDNKVQIEESVIAKEMPKEEASAAMQPPIKTESVNPAPKKEESKAVVTNDDISEKKEKPTTESVSAKDDTPEGNPVASADKKASNNTSEVAVSENDPAQILYNRLKQNMDKEKEAVITAFTDMITPVGKAFESIQGEINKSRAVGAENVSLKAKIEDLKRQLSEQKAGVQTANQSLVFAKTENEELKKQISSLESQNAELDSKLNDAYAINSRESSLEAEKIRSELKKAFAFLYEDWLEYEFSDVSEENYESLQAIIKKIFRSLERNGIDFKGNN